jgi:hypothetical protein
VRLKLKTLRSDIEVVMGKFQHLRLAVKVADSEDTARRLVAAAPRR